MAKSNQQVEELDAPTTGQLDVPETPDITPQSLASEILKDFEMPKKKPGRPKKQVVETLEDEDDSAPPAHLMKDEAVEEDETEQDAEATEGDDETETPDLEEKLATLAQETGVDPELLEGFESLDEAERFVERHMRAFYRDGHYNGYANGHSQNGNGHAEAIPAEQPPSQTKPLDVKLDDIDDDEPLKPVIKQLVERINADAKQLEDLRSADERRAMAAFEQQQQQAAIAFQNELFRISPELFGTEKKQTPRQARQMRAAFEAGDTLIRGYAARGAPLPSIARIAKFATQAEFAEELTQNKLLAHRTSIAERTKKRLGAPAKVSRGNRNAPSAKVFEGPHDQDPDILGAVRSTLSKTRD